MIGEDCRENLRSVHYRILRLFDSEEELPEIVYENRHVSFYIWIKKFMMRIWLRSETDILGYMSRMIHLIHDFKQFSALDAGNRPELLA